MTVIQNLQLPGLGQIDAANAKRLLAAAFWSYFDQHLEDVVFTTKLFGFISISVKLGQLEPVFVKIFGSR